MAQMVTMTMTMITWCITSFGQEATCRYAQVFDCFHISHIQATPQKTALSEARKPRSMTRQVCAVGQRLQAREFSANFMVEAPKIRNPPHDVSWEGFPGLTILKKKRIPLRATRFARQTKPAVQAEVLSISMLNSRDCRSNLTARRIRIIPEFVDSPSTPLCATPPSVLPYEICLRLSTAKSCTGPSCKFHGLQRPPVRRPAPTLNYPTPSSSGLLIRILIQITMIWIYNVIHMVSELCNLV